ncbi:MAG: 3-oxoacid CoA-transferase subunit B [Proteobacteria bacterium]|nr:3-oxoacid CoA-transferase subunit B [Pseudomonadota bacterium]MDA1059419.1 3-oxoacid CoA-transferase subunit B [Pseudomonadota bacterium]
MTTFGPKGLSVPQMAWRAAQDIPDGSYVNLGIGMPELVADHVPTGREIVFHSENGVLGAGPIAGPDEEDEELINAGKKMVTLVPGAALFHHADSFAMIRGGHIDVCVLGAFQVGTNGDLANWSTGGSDAIPAIGGAMDLVAGVKRVVVLTKHVTKTGERKLVETCTYPLTGQSVVSRIYSDLAVIDVTDGGFVAVEILEGLSIEDLASLTGGPLRPAPGIVSLAPPNL